MPRQTRTDPFYREDEFVGNAFLQTPDKIRLALGGTKNSRTAGNIALVERLFMRALDSENVKARGFLNSDSTSFSLMEKEKYPYNMQTVIQDYLDSTDPDVLNQAKKYRDNKNADDKRTIINDVSEKLVEDAKRLLGLDFSGYQNAVQRSTFNHIEKRHGIHGEADTSMKHLEDVARVGYILQEYDSIDITTDADGNEKYSKQFHDKNNNPSKMLKIIKK